MSVPALDLKPDVEAGLITYLTNHSDVAALSTNISTDTNTVWPLVRVNRVGGSSRLRIDSALVQVECWNGPDVFTDDARASLNLLARTVLAALQQAPWQTLTGLVVTSVQAVTSMQWLPDPDTRQQRYFHRVIVTAHH